MKEINRDNVTINYEVTGKGAITLLFVHGSCIDQTYWQQQVNYFSNFYQVVTLDLAGHGKSGKDRKHWSITGFAEDIIMLIKELDLKNVIITGHSIGADISLIIAAKYPKPLIGFIGIENFKNAATPLTPAIQQQAKTILQNLKTDFSNTNEKYAGMALLTKQTPANIKLTIIKAYRNAWPPLGIEITPEIFKIDVLEKKLLPKLPFKLYLINVDYFPTNELALKQNTSKGYEVFHLQGTCHFPMLEHPVELNESLKQAIDKIVKSNSTFVK